MHFFSKQLIVIICLAIASCSDDVRQNQAFEPPLTEVSSTTSVVAPLNGDGAAGIGGIGILGAIHTSGVDYKTYPGGIEGKTGEDGSFHYVQGDYVEFSIGDTFLGFAPGAPRITEFDLEGVAGINFDVSTRVSQVLQLHDEDLDISNGLQVNAEPSSFAPRNKTGKQFQRPLDVSRFGVSVNGIDIWASQEEYDADLSSFIRSSGRPLVLTDEVRARVQQILSYDLGGEENCSVPLQSNFFLINDPHCRDRELAWAFEYFVAPSLYAERKPYITLLNWNQERLEDQTIKNKLAAYTDHIVNLTTMAEAAFDAHSFPYETDQMAAFTQGFGAGVDEVLRKIQETDGSDPALPELRNDVTAIVASFTSINQCLLAFEVETPFPDQEEKDCLARLEKALNAHENLYLPDSLEKTFRHLRTGSNLSDLKNYGLEVKRIIQSSSSKGPGKTEALLGAIAKAASAAEYALNDVYTLYKIEGSEYSWTGQIRETVTNFAASAECMKGYYSLKTELASGKKSQGAFSTTTKTCVDAALGVYNQISVASRTVVGGIIAKSNIETLKEHLLAEVVVRERLAFGHDISAMYQKWSIGASVGVDYDALIRAIATNESLREDRYGAWDFGVLRGDEYDIEDVRRIVSRLIYQTEAAVQNGRASQFELPDEASVTIFDARANENDNELIFDLQLSHPLQTKATVYFKVLAISNDNAATINTDFFDHSGLITFPVGSTTAQISIALWDDAISEPDEHLAVELSLDPEIGTTDNLRISTPIATGVIRDDEPSSFSYTAQSVEKVGDSVAFIINSTDGTSLALYDPSTDILRTFRIDAKRSLTAHITTYQDELLLALEGQGPQSILVYTSSDGQIWRSVKTIPHCLSFPTYFNCKLDWLLSSESDTALVSRVTNGSVVQVHASWLSDRAAQTDTGARGPIMPKLNGDTVQFLDNYYRIYRVDEQKFREIRPDRIDSTLIGATRKISIVRLVDGVYEYLRNPESAYGFGSNPQLEAQTCDETQDAPSAVIYRSLELKDQNTKLYRNGVSVNGSVLYTYFLYELTDTVGCRLAKISEFVLPDGFSVHDAVRDTATYYIYGQLNLEDGAPYPALAKVSISSGEVDIIRP